jgi:hypothetical protein
MSSSVNALNYSCSSMRYVTLHDEIFRPSPEITVDENNVVQTENQDAVKFSRS